MQWFNGLYGSKDCWYLFWKEKIKGFASLNVAEFIFIGLSEVLGPSVNKLMSLT